MSKNKKTSISISKNTKEELEQLKKNNETYDEIIQNLIEGDENMINDVKYLRTEERDLPDEYDLIFYSEELNDTLHNEVENPYKTEKKINNNDYDFEIILKDDYYYISLYYVDKNEYYNTHEWKDIIDWATDEITDHINDVLDAESGDCLINYNDEDVDFSIPMKIEDFDDPDIYFFSNQDSFGWNKEFPKYNHQNEEVQAKYEEFYKNVQYVLVEDDLFIQKMYDLPEGESLEFNGFTISRNH